MAGAKSMTELLMSDMAFAQTFFQAAELEARETERYVLIALAAMYSYLATKEIPPSLHRLAWYSPTLIVVFAGVRALALGCRQGKLLNYVASIQQSDGTQGWAVWFSKQWSSLTVATGLFYLTLLCITLIIARRMTSIPKIIVPCKTDAA